MTIGELKSRLEGFDDETEVRFGTDMEDLYDIKNILGKITYGGQVETIYLLSE